MFKASHAPDDVKLSSEPDKPTTVTGGQSWSRVTEKSSRACLRRIILFKNLVETVLVGVLWHFSNCFRLDNRLVCDQPYDCAGPSGDHGFSDLMLSTTSCPARIYGEFNEKGK